MDLFTLLLAIWDLTAAGRLLILPELFCIQVAQVWDAAVCCVKIIFYFFNLYKTSSSTGSLKFTTKNLHRTLQHPAARTRLKTLAVTTVST